MVHVSTVCPLAKAFLHHLFTLKATLKPGQTRHLNLSAQTNLAWWDALIESWPGISVQQFLMLRQPDYLIPCDASETWGCGPWCTPHWLQVPWSLPSPTLNSPAGAVPSCDSSCCMGAGWTGRLVHCHSDNAPVVAQVNRLHVHNSLAPTCCVVWPSSRLFTIFGCMRSMSQAQPTQAQTTCLAIRQQLSYTPSPIHPLCHLACLHR